MRPSSSIDDASARRITSYGPVTSSACTTPGSERTAATTSDALPTSVWMRMYELTVTATPRAGTAASYPRRGATRPARNRPRPADFGAPSNLGVAFPTRLIAPRGRRWPLRATSKDSHRCDQHAPALDRSADHPPPADRLGGG